MKVKSLKQALHWLFLAIGSVAVVALLVSASTYLDYAREGYGLEVAVEDSVLRGVTLSLRVNISNPGRLSMEVFSSGLITLANGAEYPITMDADIPGRSHTEIVRSVELAADDALALYADRAISLNFNFRVSVPERDATTRLPFAAESVEVRI
jgi:hypothetical protein